MCSSGIQSIRKPNKLWKALSKCTHIFWYIRNIYIHISIFYSPTICNCATAETINFQVHLRGSLAFLGEQSPSPFQSPISIPIPIRLDPSYRYGLRLQNQAREYIHANTSSTHIYFYISSRIHLKVSAIC